MEPLFWQTTISWCLEHQNGILIPYTQSPCHWGGKGAEWITQGYGITPLQCTCSLYHHQRVTVGIEIDLTPHLITDTKSSYVLFCQLKVRFHFLWDSHGKSDKPFMFMTTCILEYCFEVTIPLFLGKQWGATFSAAKSSSLEILWKKLSLWIWAFCNSFYTIYLILLNYILHSSERNCLGPLWLISLFWWVSKSCVLWTSAAWDLQVSNGIGSKQGNALTMCVMIRWELETGTAVALAFPIFFFNIFQSCIQDCAFIPIYKNKA